MFMTFSARHQRCTFYILVRAEAGGGGTEAHAGSHQAEPVVPLISRPRVPRPLALCGEPCQTQQLCGAGTDSAAGMCADGAGHGELIAHECAPCAFGNRNLSSGTQGSPRLARLRALTTSAGAAMLLSRWMHGTLLSFQSRVSRFLCCLPLRAVWQCSVCGAMDAGVPKRRVLHVRRADTGAEGVFTVVATLHEHKHTEDLNENNGIMKAQIQLLRHNIALQAQMNELAAAVREMKHVMTTSTHDE